MTYNTSRRRLIQALGVAGVTGVSGCQEMTELFPTNEREDAPQSRSNAIDGQVVDTAETPIPDATVTALAERATQLDSTTTNRDGQFQIRTSRPVWLAVEAAGYIQRVVAAAPGRSILITVVDRSDTVAVTFGGDVMFSRRFYERPSDSLTPHQRIRPRQRRADHMQILDPVAPALTNGDITSINLESPLTTSSVRHPEKQFTYVSHPVAAEALTTAGVDYVALGNNHAFDALTQGLTDTIETIEAADIRHSGAGTNAVDAWDPVVFDTDGPTIAMLSCSAIVGGQYEVHWSADREGNRPGSITIDGEEYDLSAGTGVAEATTTQLQQQVTAASEVADVVVVQIHGGTQYQRQPTAEMESLTETAVAAGADLVVNHHPHVVGGVERINGALVAWSLGNFVFDQTLWSTFPSYLLTAYISSTGVPRAVIDPIILDGFVPKGVVGKPNRILRRRTIEWSENTIQATSTGVATGIGTTEPTVHSIQFSEPGIYTGTTGWVSNIQQGEAVLGQDLLPTGTFESVDIDKTGYDGLLWRFSRNPPASGVPFGVAGGGGIKLRRIAGNTDNAILSNGRRIPVDSEVTILAQYLTAVDSGLSLEVAWYEGTNDQAIQRESWSLAATRSQWNKIQRSVNPPSEANYMNLLFKLAPPEKGTRATYIDNIRIIEWAEEATGGAVFNYIQVNESVTVDILVPSNKKKPQYKLLTSPSV